MLDELTPDQRAKLARGWVWRPGHAFVQPHPKTGVCDYSNFARVSCVVDGEPMAMRGVGIGNPHPVLTDDVTADGLLRTARAMWRDESLHVVPVGVDFTVSPKRVLRWRLRRAVYWLGVVTEEWGETGWITSAVECPRPIDFASEEAALLAAILVAPEHQNV